MRRYSRNGSATGTRQPSAHSPREQTLATRRGAACSLPGASSAGQSRPAPGEASGSEHRDPCQDLPLSSGRAPRPATPHPPHAPREPTARKAFSSGFVGTWPRSPRCLGPPPQTPITPASWRADHTPVSVIDLLHGQAPAFQLCQLPGGPGPVPLLRDSPQYRVLSRADN